MAENTKTFEVKFTPRQKTLPPMLKMAKNLATAVVKHIKDGGRNVTIEEYTERLAVCNGCDMRLKNRCTHPSCGCFLDKKAWWASEDCPMEKWPKNWESTEIKLYEGQSEGSDEEDYGVVRTDLDLKNEIKPTTPA